MTCIDLPLIGRARGRVMTKPVIVFVLNYCLVPALALGTQASLRATHDCQDRDEVQRRIAQLGSPDFSEREAASKALDAQGEKALTALRHAANSHADPEVRQRAARLVRAIEERLAAERSFRGHDGGVYNVAFSMDGRHIFSTGYDGEHRDKGMLRVWDAQTFKELRHFTGKGIVYALALAPDGRRLATGAREGDLCLWDIQTGNAVRRFPNITMHVMALAFSPDGRWLLSGSNDSKKDQLQLWDAETGEELCNLGVSGSPTYAVAFLPDGRTALSGGKDGVIRIWEVKAGREIRRLVGHGSAVTRVAVSADGRFAISASWDETIRLWDLKTAREIRRFLGHSALVRAVKFMLDGRRALSASHDGSVRLWNVETGLEERRFDGHGDEFADVALSPDGKRVVAGSTNGTLRLWRLHD